MNEQFAPAWLTGINLKTRFQNQQLTVGSFIGLPGAVTAEIAAAAGADWLLLDLEHGGVSEADLGNTVLAAASYRVPVLVRVPQPQRIIIGRVLDAGAQGVMLPRINSRDEAAAALTHLQYPPHGDRGVATYNRSATYGLNPAALAETQQRLVGVVQIETLGALTDVSAIAELPGADVLFVGPLDLSYALGIPRDFSHPRFHDALQHVVAAAKKHGKVAGILANTTEIAHAYYNLGFRFLALGSDSTMLAQAWQQGFGNLQQTRAAVPVPPA